MMNGNSLPILPILNGDKALATCIRPRFMGKPSHLNIPASFPFRLEFGCCDLNRRGKGRKQLGMEVEALEPTFGGQGLTLVCGGCRSEIFVDDEWTAKRSPRR